MEEQQKQFVLSLLAYAVQRGVSAQHLCQLSNIDLAVLKRKSGTAITKKQITDLWKNASYLCNDPLFGLHFGESLQLAALGAVGEIIKSSDTVGQAITIAGSLTPAITDLFKMEVEKSKKSFAVRLLPTNSESEEFVSQQIADLLMVFTIHELNGFLLEKIKPNSVIYPRKLSNPTEYERVFRCKPVKRAGEYSIHFKNSYWDEPILTANYELQKLFIQRIIQNQKTDPHLFPFKSVSWTTFQRMHTSVFYH